MHSRFFYRSFACNFAPFCFYHVVRRCEASLAILEKMSARRQRFEPPEVLEMIWNDSGDEQDLDREKTSESEVESSELAREDKSDESVDSFSSNERDNVQDSEQNSGDEASNGREGGNRVNRVRQRPARRQQQAPLVWQMAHGTIQRDIPFTGNPGVQVQTVGFEPYDYFALFINGDLLNCFITESNRYANDFIAAENLRRRSRTNDWFPTNKKQMKEFLGLLFLIGIIHKPAIHMYWSKDPLFSTPIFHAIMSRNRFQLLLKFLHFNDNSNILEHLMIHLLINCSSCDLCWITSLRSFRRYMYQLVMFPLMSHSYCGKVD